jgi:hypothetical protein
VVLRKGKAEQKRDPERIKARGFEQKKQPQVIQMLKCDKNKKLKTG